MQPIKAALIGAGQRGAQSYAPYALIHPEKMKFQAVAEPDRKRRNEFASAHQISEEHCYDSYEELFEKENGIEAVLICTQDQQHIKPALKAMEKGYHILLEKPISNSLEECKEIGSRAINYPKIFLICHVLRYTPFFKTLKNLLDEGKIGELENVQWIENVGYWHQAHSFVRGNWRNSEMSSPMILAKCCHDLDLLLWLIGSECTRLSSFGSLNHFRKEKAPKGAALRCLDGCEAKDDCPYYAPKIYIDWRDDWQADVIKKVVSLDTNNDAILKALKEGPYGRCVYHCDNDVVDHQVVNMEFTNGVTASLTMSAFSYECTREIKFMGSKGEISGELEDNTLSVTDFLTGEKERILVENLKEGHGGGDEGIMEAFVQMIETGTMKEGSSDVRSALQSHYMAFAAEESRKKRTVISFTEENGS